MVEFKLLKDLLVVLAVSIPVIFVFKKFQLPSIVGFIITGILIGPFGLRLISEMDGINQLAEIGVALLLFTIGIEISLTRFKKAFKEIILTGGSQVAFTIIFGMGVSFFFGLNVPQALFMGFLLSHSSTVMILKLLGERNETDAPHGRLSIGIIVFQDLMVVPMMILIPILGLSDSIPLGDAALRLVYAFGFIAGILLAARFLMPHILSFLVNLRMRDVLLIGVIVLSLGTAWITHLVGLSFVIGAFIAGLMISETDYTHQVVSDVIPFKDIFTSLFFVSFGMLLDITFFLSNPITVISYALIIIVLKAAVLIIIIHGLKYPMRLAAMVGLGLAQIGEFSFVLALEGMKFNLLSDDLYKGFIAAAIVTLIISPIMIRLAPRVGSRVPDVIRAKQVDREDKATKLKNHVIVVGYGLNGRNLVRVLKETGIKYVVIEINPKVIKEIKSENENVIFGDSTKKDILESAGIRDAKIIVFAISDPMSVRIAARISKELKPNIHVIVRTRYVTEIDELLKLGADEVIPEEFETSIQIFSRVLKNYHIPNSVILAQANMLRMQSYGILRDVRFSEHAFEQINQILAQGTIDSFIVTADNSNADKTLKEINLRAKTNATVITVIREGQSIHNPSGEFLIKENDQLIVFGTHQAIDRAFEVLSGSETF
jgi:CPA2 family monovalent cation:H+ antiporter-2